LEAPDHLSGSKKLNPPKSDEKNILKISELNPPYSLPRGIQKWQLKFSTTTCSKVILSYFFWQFLSKKSKTRAAQT
jgi:hypothetical protein